MIGFLGGFAKGSDINHPEIWFARYLSEHYASAMYAEVFSNRETEEPLQKVYSLLDTDCDGILTGPEKQSARIILFGHSWGASQTVAFARELGKRDIPVLLTVQIDIVAKPGQKPLEIPSNVKHAVNFFQPAGRLHFFQPAGLLHGHSQIVATEPGNTLIRNFRMTYTDYPVDCGNFPWLARTFNKPHHEIENDSRVWEQITSLIDADLKDGGQRDEQAVFSAVDSR